MKDKTNLILDKINKIQLIDTHEHLIDETTRLNCVKPFVSYDDWSVLLDIYLKFDFVSAGMSKQELASVSSSEVNHLDKWKIIKPYWNFVKHTGYGQVFRHTINDLYGISQLEDKNIAELQERYINYRKKGFYEETLKRANIKSCIVNSPERPFKETELPNILHQDINANGMIKMDIEKYNENILPKISKLEDWLEIINWWFDNYSEKAVGVKVGNAYFRRLDFKKTDIELANQIFSKKISGKGLTETEEKTLQDYLFWYVIDLATKNNLPVKLHTGHQAMNNFMNLENVLFNPSDCANLCRLSPETKFIFYHISYPYYEPMISLTKHYSNAIIDMCWSWTINPIAAIDFLKKYLVTSPINKLMVFGGDDLYVENLIGHTKLARKGISQALCDLIQDKWISEQDAFEIADNIMKKNVEDIYRI